MKKELIEELYLTRIARKSGGDRYECTVDGEMVIVYWPQSISRPEGKPWEKLRVTIELS